MIVNKIEEIASQGMFYKIENDFVGLPIYLKLEGLNIAGSIKLKTAIHMINGLYKNNKITHGKTKIIESSSGNLGVALSIVCKSHLLPFICITDPNTNPNNIQLMRLYGANVIVVNERDENNGYLGTRIKTIHKMLSEDEDLIWTNQYLNSDNCEAHYLTTAREIATEFNKVDYLFIGAGTTGTLMGCAKYFKEKFPNTKIIAVDSEGSVTFGKEAKKRFIPGLGTSKRPQILDEKYIDEVIHVEEKDTIETCYKILELSGLLLGGSTGTILKGISTKKDIFKETDVVVAISPDFGERYLNSVYDKDWVKMRID